MSPGPRLAARALSPRSQNGRFDATIAVVFVLKSAR